MDSTSAFGLIVIGDEILSGRRRDRHVDAFRAMLDPRGFSLAWVQILPDDPSLLIERLRTSMQEAVPVFSCGGIGATPDDHTRRCAALAAGVALQRHAQAVHEIEARFGDSAYPQRILMADLPVGSRIIPNPYNRVPGFEINRHCFLPGFPMMAHPMAEWVLDTWYAEGGNKPLERSLRVFESTESVLVELMETLVSDYPEVSLFSLPRLGEQRFIELGFKGQPEQLDAPFAALCEGLDALGLRYQLD